MLVAAGTPPPQLSFAKQKRATGPGRPLFSIGRLLRLIVSLLAKFPGVLFEFPSLLSELLCIVEHFLLSRIEQRSNLLAGLIPDGAHFCPLFLPDSFYLRFARLKDLLNLLPLLVSEI